MIWLWFNIIIGRYTHTQRNFIDRALQFNEILFRMLVLSWFLFDENVDKFRIKLLKPILENYLWQTLLIKVTHKSQQTERNSRKNLTKQDEIFLINWAFQLQKEEEKLLLTLFIFLSLSLSYKTLCFNASQGVEENFKDFLKV